MAKSQMNRRHFLRAAGLGGLSLALAPFLPALRARADSEAPLFLIHCVFNGGWDQLMALDPRDHTRFGDPNATLYTAYDRLADSDDNFAQVLAQYPTGIIQPAGSQIGFGPACEALAQAGIFEELCIFRGVNMGTLTHDVGRRYFLTGKFPQGLAANGSALATQFVAQRGDQSVIPNLVVGLETYNDGLDHFASGLQIRSSDDLQTVLTPLGTALPEDLKEPMAAFMAAQDANCYGEMADGDGLVSQYLASREKAQLMVESDLGRLFDFSANPDDAQMQALNAAFGISSVNNEANQQFAGPAGQAMIAAQAITQGLCQAISIPLSSTIDHHDDLYLTDHYPALKLGFEALANLIAYLKSTPHSTTGEPLWNHTILMCTSDFARTPNLNNRDGRDHHLSSSCLLAGKGIAGNRVIGATDDVSMAEYPIDPSTGLPQESGGLTLRPVDIHATLLAAVGLSADHLSNQSPQVVSAALQS